MTSSIELYEKLRAYLPDEAARLIADRLPQTQELATKADLAEVKADLAKLEATTKADLAKLEATTKAELADLKADIRGWMLSFFVPLWIGVYGTLAAVVVSLVLRG